MYGSGEYQVSTQFASFLDQEIQFPIAWPKLTIPQQASTHLKRSRLVDMIHNMIDRKLVLIRAPAGYGKTSLLVELAHETDLPVCWYSIEEQDSDLNLFLTYLIASISRRFPSFGQRSTQLLQSMSGQTHTHLRVLVATLVDEILNTVPEYFFLILDDYHAIEENSYVHEFIRLMIDFMPEQCHLIVSARKVPPFPLIRLVARQQMAAIGIDDLRFSEQESHQLISAKLSLSLSRDQIRLLMRQTDGWITAILLSANVGLEALLSGEMPSAASLTETGIYDYLMNEVFGCQPMNVQRFLLHTAILKEMTEPLCDELTGQACRDELQLLEKSSLFISRVQEVGIETTYRYNPLFRDFLLSRLRDQDESLYHELNARAARLFAQRQDWQLAIHHHLEARQFAQVKRIIMSNYDDLDLAGMRESMTHWIDILPIEYISPDLQIRRAALATELGQIDTALCLYTNTIALYESQDNKIGMAFALIERSRPLAKSGEYANAIQDCQQALFLLAEQERMDSLRGRAYRYLGRFHGETGRPEAALHFLQLAQECWERCDEPPIRMARLAQDMGATYEIQGAFDVAIKKYKKAYSIWERLGNERELALALNGIGAASHRLGKYETASQVLHDALSKSQDGGFLLAEAYTLVSLGDLYRDLGQFDRAIELYDQGYQKSESVGEAYLRSYVMHARVEAFCLSGQIENAQRALEETLSKNTLPKAFEYRCRLSLASTLLVQNKEERARQEIETLLAESSVTKDVAFRGQIRLARISMSNGDAQKTQEHLKTAFRLAREAGLTQILSVESLSHLEVLQFAKGNGDQDKELDRWIAAAKKLKRTRKQLARTERVQSTTQHLPFIQIHALGGSNVFKDDTPVSWRTTQAKELFFYLLTHSNGETKEQIGASIWPEHSQAKLFSIFRSSLFRVRKALFSEIVLFEQDQYSLNPQANYAYDVQVFERAISKGNLGDSPAQKAYHYRQAIDLYQGSFLADLYADWISSFRESLQAKYLQALLYLSQFHFEGKRYPETIEFARRIKSEDEYYELAYYLLAMAYARSGQRPKAKRTYEECRAMLAEFDLTPQKSWSEICQ